MEIGEASTSVARSAGTRAPRTLPPGAVLLTVLQEGLAQVPSTIKRGRFPLAGEVEWTAVCTVAHRCRIAPIVYQCLRASALPVPRDVMDWFRVQHYDTVARNLASLNELDAVLHAFAAAAIPAMVFKGPALAHFGNEMARSWQDLDILIHRGSVDRVESVLLKAGYPPIPGPVHRNHRRYAGAGNTHRGVLEIHFNISDPLRSHQPDVPAIWDRSAEMKILGVSARIPELTDHLLLTIMQLPHHHWSVRLLVDILHVVTRWQGEIDWDELFRRAASWQMIALTRTALWVLITGFGASLPGEVVSRVQPAGYYDRFHRGIAGQAIDEQLGHPFRPKMLWIAPFVVVDRPSKVPAILARRLVLGSGPSEEGKVERAFRRNVTTLAALPAVMRLLISSLRPSSGNGKVVLR